MSDLGIRPGDRVKVHTEYEGTVDWMDPHRYAVKDDDGNLRRVARTYRGTEVTKVEPPEPPPVPFKPGDRLRRKGGMLSYEITLADNGYVHHYSGGKQSCYYMYSKGPDGPDGAAVSKLGPGGEFTSKYYEKVV